MRTFLIILLALTGCNKAVVQGKDRPIQPISRSFAASVDETFEAAKKSLRLNDYEIQKENSEEKTVVTEWMPTKATSHYTEVFGEKDYGTIGAYFHLRLKVQERDGKAEVQITAPVRSLAGYQRSTYREEKKIFKKIADLLRSDSFKMTNLGVEE
ncbi:MAG: hypothetical protein HY539_06570 [Deltaproteobacteria bacterium]|nr:hypothetical protein [Deltaproteobacteria bacterium]